MADESSPTKEQKNRAAASILGMFLGLIAVIFGTAELLQSGELLSWVSLVVLGGLLLLAGSLVWYIKVAKVYPRPTAKSDITSAILFFTFASAAIVLFFTLGSKAWNLVGSSAFLLLVGLFLLGRGLSNRSKESAAKAAPETPDATPPEDDE